LKENIEKAEREAERELATSQKIIHKYFCRIGDLEEESKKVSFFFAAH
jgi:hypothetical protein